MRKRKFVPVTFARNAHYKMPLIALCLVVIALTLGATASFKEEISELNFAQTVLRQDPSPLELEIREMVKGYPIENMAPYIAKEDPKVAAFLVSIAKKESDWGKRVPVLDGKDCYNYWGYRGKWERMGTGGHTCFNNRREAVKIVARRIDTLVNEKNLDTPKEMIVWKCGYNCAGHSESSVSKWIADVSFYFKKFK